MMTALRIAALCLAYGSAPTVPTDLALPTATLSAARGTYVQGEVVALTLTFSNRGTKRLRFAYSPSPLDAEFLKFSIIDPATVLREIQFPRSWRGPGHPVFDVIDLGPGETRSYHYRLGVQPATGALLLAAPGRYQLRAWMNLGAQQNTQLQVSTDVTTIDVLAPPADTVEALREYATSGLAAIAQADEWQADPTSSTRLADAERFVHEHRSSPYVRDLKCGLRNVLDALGRSNLLSHSRREWLRELDEELGVDRTRVSSCW